MRKSYEFYKILKNAHFLTKFVRRTRFVHNFKILTDFAMRFFLTFWTTDVVFYGIDKNKKIIYKKFIFI